MAARTLAALALAALGAGLWLLWGYEHEQTSIRAPWTGITFAAAGLAFVLAGVVGRGWRALLVSALVAAATVLLEAPVWRDEPPPPEWETCDPGCISVEAAATMAAIAAAVLTAAGIAVRRLAARL